VSGLGAQEDAAMRFRISSTSTSPLRLRPALAESGDGVEDSGKKSAVDAAERRYLERLLGHPPSAEDAALLPGIDVSDLGEP